MPYADPERQREFHRKRRAKIRQVIVEAKARPCEDCGVEYPTCVMQFDHVRGEKKLSIGSATALIKSLIALHEEIAKCEVVCANCHALRTETRKWSGMDEETVLKTAGR